MSDKTDAAWISAGGSVLSSLLGMLSTNAANEDAKKIARENRKWMERMANTAHQREVADLREAGLNPILSATGGSGAATPSASTAADVKTPDFSGIADIGESIARISKLEAETKNIDTATSLLETDKISKQHDAFMKGIEAQFAEDRVKYGLDEARNKAIKSLIELDKSTARAAFDLSPLGLQTYAAKNIADAYPGSVSVKAGGSLGNMFQKYGLDLGGSVPAYVIKQLQSAKDIQSTFNWNARHSKSTYIPEILLKYNYKRGSVKAL